MMMTTVREALRRRLPQTAFQQVRSCAWHGRYYWPRVAASLVVHRKPTVHGYPRGRSSTMLPKLAAVNVFAPTDMCRVMTRHGSDKGNGWHNYTTIYSVLFGGRRREALSIFELGLGTDNPELISSMGVHGRPGASLRGWRELFPQAQVFGADIDRAILFADTRINTFYCDQRDSGVIAGLWQNAALQPGMDIIVDDGLHEMDANLSFLDGSLKHLRPGGYYIVEDILQESVAPWCQELEKLATQRPGFEYALLELPNPANTSDNNLLIIHRRP